MNMRNILLFLIIFLFNITSVKAWVFGVGYFNFSFSKEFYDYDSENIDNYSFGYEIFSPKYPKNIIKDFGLNIRYGDNGFILSSFYSLIPFWIAAPEEYGEFFNLLFGIGSNISYNISKNIFGIGPQVHIDFIFAYVIKFRLLYRYNIYFNDNNSNEIELFIGFRHFL